MPIQTKSSSNFFDKSKNLLDTLAPIPMATYAQMLQDIKEEIYDMEIQQNKSMTPFEKQMYDIKCEKLQEVLKRLCDLTSKYQQMIDNQKPNLKQAHETPSPKQKDIYSLDRQFTPLGQSIESALEELIKNNLIILPKKTTWGCVVLSSYCV